jgi:diguanylate cyclase (GGDEF)-like protein/PAS domain S-box-containing protein
MTLSSTQYVELIASSQEKIPQSVLIIDVQGRVIYISEPTLIRLGYGSRELEHTLIQDIIPTFCVEQYVAEFESAAIAYKALEVTVHTRDKGPMIAHLMVTYERVLQRNFLVVQVVSTSPIIATEKQSKYITESDAREQIELLHFLIDEVPSPIVIKDYDGKFVLTNKAVAELYGAPTPESMIGKDDGDYIPNRKLADAFKSNVRQIMDKGKTKTVFEDSIDVNTGEVRNFQSIKKPFINKNNEKNILLVATDVTELRNIQSDLEEQKNLFRQVIDEFPSPFLVKDYDGKFVLTNKALATLYNVEKPESMIGKDDRDYLPHLKHNVRSIMDKGETQIVYEDSFDVNTGNRHHYMSIKKPFVNHKGEQQILVIANDITEMRKAEKILMQYEKIMSVSHDFLSYEDENYTYQAVNETYLKAFQLSHDEIIGKSSRELFGDEFFFRVIKPKFDEALQGVEVHYETWVTFPALGQCFIDVSYHPYFEKYSRVVEGVVVKIDDITERFRTKEKLRYIADHDILTGLPNRRLFSERLSQALERARRYERLVSVFFIDLDRFKVINDSLGHAIGDKVLQNIARRLLNHIRKSDVLARSGGDEFLLLLDDFDSADNVVKICQTFLEELNKPILIEDHELFVSASIGASIFPSDASNETELIQSADAAMYQAKKRGRNTYQLSNEALRLRATERFNLEKNLRSAIDNDEFFLCYQPQIDMRTKEMIGAEALIRWKHPLYGILAPDKFIPVAEESGVILSLGKWVLYEACSQMLKWQQHESPFTSISVNVSGNQLLQASFTDMVKECLRDTQLPAHFLTLEVTESYLMNDTINVASQLQILRDLGVNVSIDDFGTSYSSLRYLQELPISTLKIDRSFVKDIPRDKGDCAIVKTIIDLAHNLEIEVIAEGVEDITQEEFLISQGCYLAQGFMYSKPLVANIFSEKFLKQQ